jgi:hypothetical protein
LRISCDSALFGILTSRADTVGHEEQSLSSVVKSHLGRAEYSDRTAVTQSFQCRNEGFKLSVGVPRDVLAEDTRRPHARDDADELVDKPSVIRGSTSSAGDAVGLAWISRSDAIHHATPRVRVEGSNVVPNRSRG